MVERAPINTAERDWARECMNAGDTLAEVAQWSGRTEAEWRPHLNRWIRLSATQRERLSLISAGVTQEAVASELGCSRKAVAATLHKLRSNGFEVPFGAASVRAVRP